MNRSGQLLKMGTLMFLLGMLLGAIAGFLVGWVLLISDVPISELPGQILGITFISGFYGGMFGGLYGGMSGFISGLGMVLVTAVGFREIRNVRRFRIVMGLITAIMTGGVFLLGGLWDFGYGLELAWTSAMVLSVVIAVYASQIIAKKYIKEMSLRKRKGSPHAAST